MVAPTDTTPAPAAPPTFDAVEAKLLGAAALVIEYQIVSEGAFPAEVKGDVHLTRDNRLRWRASGTFGGKPLSIDHVADASAGVHLAEAVVLGWTRMGLLHNIARLSGGQPIDRAAGGAATWLAVTPTKTTAETIAYDLVVDGQPSGSGTLDVDSLGTPRGHTMRVQFASGSMTVTERYSVRIADGLDPAIFVP
jgi:hypothetical protein